MLGARFLTGFLTDRTNHSVCLEFYDFVGLIKFRHILAIFSLSIYTFFSDLSFNLLSDI